MRRALSILRLCLSTSGHLSSFQNPSWLMIIDDYSGGDYPLYILYIYIHLSWGFSQSIKYIKTGNPVLKILNPADLVVKGLLRFQTNLNQQKAIMNHYETFAQLTHYQ